MTPWLRVHVDQAFHAKVRAACWDSPAGELLQVHALRRRRNPGVPLSLGCDTAPTAAAPLWPCTTYSAIASRALALPRRDDVRQMLLDMVTGSARPTDAGGHPVTRVYGYQGRGSPERIVDGLAVLDHVADRGYNLKIFLEPPGAETRKRLGELIVAAQQHRVTVVVVPSYEDLGDDAHEQDLTRKLLKAAGLDAKLAKDLP